MTRFTRRRLLAVAGGSFVAGAAVRPSVVRSTQRFDAEAHVWPGPHGDGRGTGAVPETTGPTEATVAWEYEYRAPSVSAVPLALADETLIVGDRDAMRGLEPTDGSQRWSYALPHPFADSTRPWRNAVRLPPWIVDDRVIAVFDTNVCALALSNGRLQWRVQTNTSIDAALVAGNTVIFDGRISGTNALWALDTETGVERWMDTTDGDRRLPIAATDGRLYTVRYGDRWSVAAHDLETGEIDWRESLEGRPLASGPRAAVTADGLYVGAESLVALDRDGGQRWRADLGTAFGRALAVAHELVFATDVDASEVVALETTTGDRRWSASVSNLARPGGLSVDADTVYVSTTDGFRALEIETGEERFRFDGASSASSDTTTNPTASGPVIPTVDRLYQSVGNRVYALEGRA
ncbi:PQQ-binding-like beta-propeller repeat protein [Natronoglomus mannanivorans]|uniref:PQQ-binding-like beta-propeller repeat protein n=1 Tax=Natronoglomus mannanivorans TaxID=2979990 RepID=A0AAP2Z0Y2_9EURY|nr:PQQ-binding-like beta-propeller repeat protein [Halobacteria archaeon AArc-xg1-1]